MNDIFPPAKNEREFLDLCQPGSSFLTDIRDFSSNGLIEITVSALQKFTAFTFQLFSL